MASCFDENYNCTGRRRFRISGPSREGAGRLAWQNCLGPSPPRFERRYGLARGEWNLHIPTPGGLAESDHGGCSPARNRRRMNGYLLDTNLLIALLWPSQQHHELAMKWFTRRRARGWATCP